MYPGVMTRTPVCAFAVALTVASCVQEPSSSDPSIGDSARAHPTHISLEGSGYVYDVAVADGAIWVTSHAGLYRVDPVTNEAVNVLRTDSLFRVEAGHGALWVSDGQSGQVLRVDPRTAQTVAEIDMPAGPVTRLAVSPEAVWVSAVSNLVRIDPDTNRVVGRVRSEETFGDVAFGEGVLWAIAGANARGAVWRIDPSDGTVEQKTPLPNPGFWNELEVATGAVWVTSSPTVDRNGEALVHLHRIDPSTGAITAHIPLGEGASGLGPEGRAVSLSTLAVDGGSLWVLVDFEGTLLRLDSSDLTVTATFEGLAPPSSDVGTAMTTGVDALWVTRPGSVMRVGLGSG
jgi:streptogramin lyase